MHGGRDRWRNRAGERGALQPAGHKRVAHAAPRRCQCRPSVASRSPLRCGHGGLRPATWPRLSLAVGRERTGDNCGARARFSRVADAVQQHALADSAALVKPARAKQFEARRPSQRRAPARRYLACQCRRVCTHAHTARKQTYIDFSPAGTVRSAAAAFATVRVTSPTFADRMCATRSTNASVVRSP